ncbi:MAG: hypothetical protein K2N77_00145, partial [Lachnospiraceae bacterium]|nr:hypothetical protein [Lachnospiraceae bacterium]
IGMFERTDMSDTQREKNIVDHYILKAYEEGKVDFFAVLSGELDEESRKSWLERCKKDGRADYYYILSDEYEDIFDDTDFIDDDDYFDEWDDDSSLHASSAPNILDLNRITEQDISTALQNVLDSCDSGKWYVITENDCQYIYYNGLPHTYAYEPHIDGSETGDLITVAITDINMDSRLLHHREAVSDYVLLLLSYAPVAPDKDYNLTITYNGAHVTYDTISVASGAARSIAALYPDTPQYP